MREEDPNTRWLVLTLLFGAVGGSLAGILGLSAALGSLPWTLPVPDLEAAAVGGGLYGAGLTFLLTAVFCALLRDRPFPAGAVLLLPIAGSALIGALVFALAGAAA